MPKVSVIIPSYNRANLVGETIQSVLDQSFRDYEIIVVDDGSTDDTQDVVERFRIKYIRQSNQGLPNARNTGIRAARGKYIAILDSDDCLYQQSLAKRVEVLEKYTEAAFAYGQICTIDEKSRLTGLRYPLLEKSGLREGKQEIHDLLYANHIPASTVMIRRSCLDEAGLFNPNYIHGQEDLEMWVRLASRFDSVYIAEPLVKLRQHSQRMTQQLGIEIIESNHRQIVEAVLADRDLGPLFIGERQKIYANLYFFMAEVAYTRQAMGLLRSYIVKAVQSYPNGLTSRIGVNWMMLLLRSTVPLFMLNSARIGKRAIHSLKGCLAQPINQNG